MIKLSDLLLNPKRAERHPFEIIFIGFFYASLSLLFSIWLFPEYASLFMVFLAVLSCLYVVQGALIIDEKKEKDSNPEYKLLRRHFKTLLFFMFLFIGFLAGFTFWALLLPEKTLFTAFSIQDSVLQNISIITGNSVYYNTFFKIISNNIRVLLISLLLALFYGAGAVFILAWNASIMGFVIASLTRNVFGFSSFPRIVLKYFLHGIPEMFSYFAAALAGGIFFISLIKGDIKKGKIKRIITDFFIILLASVFLLFLAALIETYISPLV